MQWTKAGNWYGGSWPAPVPALPANATTGWRALGQEFVVPLDADPGTVYVSVLNGYELTKHTSAAFANVSLVEVPPPPLRSIVLAPAYRGRVTKHGPDAVVVRAWTHLPAVPVLEAALYRSDGAGRSGPPIASVRVVKPAADTPIDLEFDTPPRAMLPTAGAYTLVVRCLDQPSGGGGDVTTLAETAHAITRVADAAPDPKVWVDGRQRLVVDGALFFPIGLYYKAYAADGMNESAMSLVGASKFNMIMPYDPETNTTNTRLAIDLAHRHGIRTMVDVVPAGLGSPGSLNGTRARIAALRDHPGVLGWYASDERGMDCLPALRQLYSAIAALDPDHPSWSVFTVGQVAHIEDFIDAFDVVGTDPYPIGQVRQLRHRF